MRYFRTASGWLHDTMSPVGVAMEDNEADLAAYYGVPVIGVEVADGEADPRWGEFVPQPPAPEVIPTPNPNGFLLAAMATLGLVPGNALLAKWPTFTVALNASNWTISRQVLGAALQAKDLTQQQYDTLEALLTEHGIPDEAKA